MSGRGYNFTMNELGLYPKSWTRDLHKKIFGKYSVIGKKKKKKEAKVLSKEKELLKLKEAETKLDSIGMPSYDGMFG